MEKLATEEAVWKTCDQISAEGRKVTGRAVKKEIGGSLETIFPHIDTWKARDTKCTLTIEIPADVQRSIRLALDQSVLKATAELSTKVEEAAEREKEILEDLVESEKLNAALNADLSAANAQIIVLQQMRNEDSASAAATISGLREQIGKLDQEKNDLILSREEAKMEVAKFQLQLDRADVAVSKLEEKALELEKQTSALMESKAEAEKANAVADRHAEDLSGQIVKIGEELKSAGATIARLESEKSELIRDLSAAVSSSQRAEATAEQMELRILECVSTNGQLRQELETVRKESVLTAEQHLHRLREYEANINQLRKEMDSIRKESIEAKKPVGKEIIIDDAQSESSL